MASLINKLWSKIKLQQKRHLGIMIVGLDNSGKTTVLRQLTAIKNNSNGGLIDQSRNLDWIGQFLEIQPTISYHFEVAKYKNSQITVVDFSGQSRYRNLWCEYYSSVDAIVFVIDSTDSLRLVVVKDELEQMLGHESFTSLTAVNSNLKNNPTTASDLNQQRQHQLVQQKQQQQLMISDNKLIKQPLNASNNQHHSNKSKKDAGFIRRQVPILFMANKMDQTGQAMSVKSIIRALDLQLIPTDKHPWHIQATSALTGKGVEAGMDWLMSQLDMQTTGGATSTNRDSMTRDDLSQIRSSCK